MPEKDLRIAKPVEIDDDLLEMTTKEIPEQYGLASAAFTDADRAVNDCIRKYAKKGNDGS